MGPGKFFDKCSGPGFIHWVTRARRHLRFAVLGAAIWGWLSLAGAPEARRRAPQPLGAIETPQSAPAGVSSSILPLDPQATPASSAAAVWSPAILRHRTRAQERILGRDRAIEDEFGRVIPAEQIVLHKGTGARAPNGNALGQFVPVENEPALQHFHEALAELARAPEAKNKVRIAAYGASHTQADIYSGYLRYYLQSRFGNGGTGFIPLGVERGWSHRIDFNVRGRGFKVHYAQKKPVPREGRFGLAGAAAVAGARAWVKISPDNRTDPDLTASQYGLFYAAEPHGGDIAVSVDGDPPVRIPTRAGEAEPRYHTFERPLGWHDVEIRTLGSGSARLFGLSVERAQPGLVIDTMGIRGTRAANMLLWDRALWEEHLRRRAPDLILLAYGTNETTDRGQPIEKYEAALSEVLTRIRHALPEASCVLIGPGDFPKARRGEWITRPRLLEIIATQRRLAPQFRCGFWDTYAFMGGEGSMERWVRASPRLGSPDHIHLTARGYVKMGMVLGDALLRGYDAQRLPSDVRIAGDRLSDAAASPPQSSTTSPR